LGADTVDELMKAGEGHLRRECISRLVAGQNEHYPENGRYQDVGS
jgi:hypothetical protein